LEKEGEKEELEYKDQLMKVQPIWNVKVKEMPIIIVVQLKVYHEHSESV
jgi:hypothetical protein